MISFASWLKWFQYQSTYPWADPAEAGPKGPTLWNGSDPPGKNDKYYKNKKNGSIYVETGNGC